LSLPIDKILIDYIYSDTPAFEKLLPDDEIEEINDIEVKEKTFFEISQAIRNEPETIKIKVSRLDDPMVFSKIELKKPAVYSRGIKQKNYDYRWIRINHFIDGSSSQFQTELERANKWGSNGIILDLRGNPGGLVDEGAKILKMLIPYPGELFHTQKMEKDNGYKSEIYKTNGKVVYSEPMIVLVDSETASTAEIVAQVLKNQSRALVIGDTSFGKGTVQITKPVSTLNGFGGMIITTVAMAYYPNHETHQNSGVQPDYTIQDPRLDEALEKLKTSKDPFPFIQHENEYANSIQPLGQSSHTISENNILQFLRTSGFNEIDDLSYTCDGMFFQDCLETQATRFLEIMVNRH
jgi:carboxyl-terminal processing protease